ncbi:pistil-specific extensin-like protein [Apium graveolens]|uniref:pistil-specific extensin-like protein n=1 Tax=Apium graveolens TaxID=4045 RepID=UPI003D7BCF54
MGEMVLLIIASSLLMASVSTGIVGAANDEVINVGGKVLCQDCTQGWNEWLNGAKPIKGSRVSITCFNEGRIVYYGSDETDETGEYEITFIDSKKINPRDCFLRLVSSPDPVCNIATNTGGGREGVALDKPTIVYRDITKYLLGSFYYTTPMCDEPDATGSENKF